MDSTNRLKSFGPENGDKALSILEASLRINHATRLKKGILANREVLVEKGILGADIDEEEVDRMVEGIVDTAFNARTKVAAGSDFNEKFWEWAYSLGGREAEVMDFDDYVSSISRQIWDSYRSWFTWAGISFPVLGEDWRVDRTWSIANRLCFNVATQKVNAGPREGEKAIIDWEDKWVRKYGTGKPGEAFYHWHKGVGNGVFADRIRETRSEGYGRSNWIEIGNGDRFYYLLDPLLKSKLVEDSFEGGPDYFGQSLNKILLGGIQRHLSAKRREDLGAHTWVQGDDFYDVNVIYECLANPDTFIGAMGFSEDLESDVDDFKVYESIEYEADTRVGAGDILQYLSLVRYFQKRDLSDLKLARIVDYFAEDLGEKIKWLDRAIEFPEDFAEVSDIAKYFKYFKLLYPASRLVEPDWDALALSETKRINFVKKLRSAFQRFRDRLNSILGRSDHNTRMISNMNKIKIIADSVFKSDGEDFVLNDMFRQQFKELQDECDGFEPPFSSCDDIYSKEDLRVLYEYVKGFQRDFKIRMHSHELDRSKAFKALGFDTHKEPRDFLAQIYDDELLDSIRAYELGKSNIHYYDHAVRGVYDGQGNILRYEDLNKLEIDPALADNPSYLTNVYLGKFTEMPNILKHPVTGERQQVHMITSVRSDSHESDEEFRKDIAGNLDMLAQGGIMHIDGFMQSETRLLRLDIIKDEIEKHGDEFKAWVFFDGNMPYQVTIQKSHPNGFYTEEDLKEAFRPEMEIVELDKAVSVPYIRVNNEVRRVLLDKGILGRKINGRRIKQSMINAVIERMYTEVLLEQAMKDEYADKEHIRPVLETVFFVHFLLQYLAENMQDKQKLWSSVMIKFLEMIFGLENFHKDSSRFAQKIAASKEDQDNKFIDPVQLMNYGAHLFYMYFCKGVAIPTRPSGSSDQAVVDVYSALNGAIYKLRPNGGPIDVSVQRIKEFAEELERYLPDKSGESRFFLMNVIDIAKQLYEQIDEDDLDLIINKFHYARVNRMEMRFGEGRDSVAFALFTLVLSEVWDLGKLGGDGAIARIDTLPPMLIDEVVTRALDYFGASDLNVNSIKFDPSKLIVFRRDGADVPEDVNRGLSFDKEALPDNSDVEAVSEEEKQRLRESLEALSRKTGLQQPIFFVNFVDCVTNKSFLDRFKEYGIEQFVRVHDVDLTHIDFQDSSKAQRVLREMEPYLGRMIFEDDNFKRLQGVSGGAGGLVIVGGNWDNTPSEGGKAAKRNIFYPILDSMTRAKPETRPLRGLFVCFGAQEWQDILASRFLKPVEGLDHHDYMVQQGMFEFGMFPFERVKGSKVNEEIFRGVPSDKLSIVVTHGGQVPMKVNDMNRIVGGERNLIEPIGMNLATGLPMGYSSLDGRVTSFVGHPEVSPEHIQRVMDEMRGFKAIISQAVGGVPFSWIESGFDVPVRGDAGGRILFNTIDMHVKSMLDQPLIYTPA